MGEKCVLVHQTSTLDMKEVQKDGDRQEPKLVGGRGRVGCLELKVEGA